tara:strand:+ start:3681 stop:4604 length:924 start_codon:yes stop_codon:yes gene_type:complete
MDVETPEPSKTNDPTERLTLRECAEKGILEKRNPHPHDKRLTFEEIGHHYFVDGVRHDELHYLSSTTLLGKFFPSFDKEKCIFYIMRSRRYVSDPEYRYYRMSEEDILQQWADIGQDASSRGSYFHISAEYHCNDIPSNDNSPEFRQYLEFREAHPELVPFRTEMLIFDPKYRVVGSVDAVFQNLNTNKFLIVDWKRSKKVSGKGGDKGFWPLEHLRSANLTKYSLQLSLYTYMLEQNYGLEMENSALVVCHPNQTEHQMIRTTYMRDEVELMMNYRLLQLYKAQVLPMPAEITENEAVDWDLIRDL